MHQKGNQQSGGNKSEMAAQSAPAPAKNGEKREHHQGQKQHPQDGISLK
jgi:hypothetical protein